MGLSPIEIKKLFTFKKAHCQKSSHGPAALCVRTVSDNDPGIPDVSVPSGLAQDLLLLMQLQIASLVTEDMWCGIPQNFLNRTRAGILVLGDV